MQNPIQKFRQSSIVFEKPGILSENLKTLTSSNYPAVQYFLLKLRTCFLLTNVYKRVCGIFLILFRTWVICQNQKIFGFYKLTKARFIDKSGSKQNPTHPSVEFRRPSFQFFRQITCNHSPNMEMALVFMWNSLMIGKV